MFLPSLSLLLLLTLLPFPPSHPQDASLGFRPNGCTSYYSSNCTEADAAEAQAVLSANNVHAYNTRMRKTEEGGVVGAGREEQARPHLPPSSPNIPPQDVPGRARGLCGHGQAARRPPQGRGRQAPGTAPCPFPPFFAPFFPPPSPPLPPSQVRLVFGDFAPIMARVVRELKSALPFAANEHQKAMLEAYISSFETGSVEDHIQGSREWIKDKVRKEAITT